MQWWGALTKQFTELAANAMKDSAPCRPSLAGAMSQASCGQAAGGAGQGGCSARPRRRRARRPRKRRHRDALTAHTRHDAR